MMMMNGGCAAVGVKFPAHPSAGKECFYMEFRALGFDDFL
jgi:hypothetical protein